MGLQAVAGFFDKLSLRALQGGRFALPLQQAAIKERHQPRRGAVFHGPQRKQQGSGARGEKGAHQAQQLVAAGAAIASGTAFVIPRGAENPDGACAWMVEVTSLDAWDAAGEARAATIAEGGGVNTGLFTGSPAADQAIREAHVQPSGNDAFDQVIQTYYEVVEYGQSFGASPVGQEIATELTNAMTAALLGDKTAEEALADAQATVMRAYENVSEG